MVLERNVPTDTHRQADCAAEKWYIRNRPQCTTHTTQIKLGQEAPGEGVSLSGFLFIGIRDTMHLVPSVPHGDGGRGGRNPALCLSGYFPDEVPHTGDIPAVSAARHVMNVPVVLRDFPGPGPAGAGTRFMNAMGG